MNNETKLYMTKLNSYFRLRISAGPVVSEMNLWPRFALALLEHPQWGVRGFQPTPEVEINAATELYKRWAAGTKPGNDEWYRSESKLGPLIGSPDRGMPELCAKAAYYMVLSARDADYIGCAIEDSVNVARQFQYEDIGANFSQKHLHELHSYLKSLGPVQPRSMEF